MTTLMQSSRANFRDFESEIAHLAQTWTQSVVYAREAAHSHAVYSVYGNRSFKELHENANRVANALQVRGLAQGDAVALMCRNRAEFLEVFLGCMRIGLRLTPINTHLTLPEVAYIVQNCAAKVFFIEQVFADAFQQECAVLNDAEPFAVMLARTLSDNHESFDALGAVVIDARQNAASSYARLLGTASAALPSELAIGALMLYTSGTTGKPKGVLRDTPDTMVAQYAGTFANYDTTTDTALCCGPAYHSAPLLFDLRWPLASGVPIVLMDKWDALETLTLIETHGVTHTHMVATMFQRLLTIAPEIRASKNTTSLRCLIHGAAPCPLHVKHAMIEWLGPVLTEYYGATEGGDGINISSQEWLLKPGAVGRFSASLGHVILDDDLRELPVGKVGAIFFKAPQQGRFAYFGDPDKTAAAYAGDRFTLGDLGYVDDAGYLFLTGRTADCIISGGVNVYPQEVDNVLLSHPAVRDACTVGVADDQWGERVTSIVVVVEGQLADDAFSAELMRFCSARLASYKRPKTILFETDLPRTSTGKLQRQLVRQRFWPRQN